MTTHSFSECHVVHDFGGFEQELGPRLWFDGFIGAVHNQPVLLAVGREEEKGQSNVS